MEGCEKLSAPNYQQAANDGLLGINDQVQPTNVQWSPQTSSLNWIFPQTEEAPAQKMTDLTRQEVDAKLAQNKAEVDARLANFDTSIKTGFADLRAEFAALRTEIADGRTDATKQSHDSMKWIIATVISTVSISVAIIGLFINLSKGDKQPVAQQFPQQQAPLVITVPAGSAVLSAPQAPAAGTPPSAK